MQWKFQGCSLVGTRGTFQYAIRYFIVRFCEVLKFGYIEFNYRISLKFGRLFGNSAAETKVKLKIRSTNSNTNLTASLCEILHLIWYWNRHLPANNRPWNFHCNLYSIVDGDIICVMDYKMHLTIFICLCLYSCSMLCERCIANRSEDWCCFLPLLSNNILLAVSSSTSISAPRTDVLMLPFRCLLCTNTLYRQHYHKPYCPCLSKKVQMFLQVVVCMSNAFLTALD